MNVFLAILGDSIRLLRARTLFWVTLSISFLLGLAYLSISPDTRGISIFFGAYHVDFEYGAKGSPLEELSYMAMFVSIVVHAWLTWIALALALISCAPIFPEFMLEGASGVTLSKPVSRLALFFYKYIGALMFAAIQTLVVALLALIAIRWRMGVWSFSVFWSVPIVTLVFSYLYSIQVFIGVKTRSVMLSILGVMGVWAGQFSYNVLEANFYNEAIHGKNAFTQKRLSKEDQASSQKYYDGMHSGAMFLPKTSATTEILSDVIKMKDGKTLREAGLAAHNDQSGNAVDDPQDSPAVVIFSSLGFELVVLGAAAWTFNRRDF